MITDDDRRSKLWLILILILLAIMFFLQGFFVREEIENNFSTITAVPSPYFVNTQVYGTYMVIDGEIKEYEHRDYDFLADQIILCESGWNQYAKNPYSTAYGLGQFTDSTWEYVQNKWRILLNRNSYEDQLYAVNRLLREEGTSHWEESRLCWE